MNIPCLIQDVLLQGEKDKPLLTKRIVPGDGDCLYHCLQIAADRGGAKAWRKDIAEEIEKNWHYYAPFSPDVAMPKLLHGIRGREWGDGVSVQAASQILMRPILIWREKHPDQPATPVLPHTGEVNIEAKTLYLILDETNKNSEHYTYLQLPSEEDVSGSEDLQLTENNIC